MGLFHLDRMLNPKSIAVIGASERPESVGAAVMRNLVDGGFPGAVYPINPRRRTVRGLQAYPDLREAPGPIDMAVVATPIDTVPGIIQECGAKGVAGVVVLSAGGRETGEGGRRLEEAIARQAAEANVRIIGPNCLGLILPSAKLNASFAAHMPKAGRLAFISQSGALCTAILDLSLQEGIGFSHFVSIGSMLDVDFADLIDFLGNEFRVTSILLYVESIPNLRKFMSAARAVSRIKPIVVLKSGKSPAGARAASSHTGAMAGEDALYDAAFRRAGVLRVQTIGELFDCAELLAKQPRPEGPRLAIITNAGGPGVMAADALAEYGLAPAPLGEESLAALDKVLPPFWSRNNPVDILGDASPERYAKALQVCLDSTDIDGVLLILTPQAMTDPSAVARQIASMIARRARLVLASWMGGINVQEGRNILNQAGIPTYATPEQAIRAFMELHQYAVNQKMLKEIPKRFREDLTFDSPKAEAILRTGLTRPNGVLTEVESKGLLEAYGIPTTATRLAADEDQVVRCARELGFPVVLKICSPDIVHKTEAGGIQLDLQSEEQVRDAFRSIVESARAYNPDAEIQGVSVQPMLRNTQGPAGVELIVGAKKDDQFGPVILFGMGGILAELLKDRSLGLSPLNRALARRLMEDTKVYKVLQGYRNLPAADMAALEELLIRLSQLLTDFPEIAELDMNPVILQHGRPWAVDARVLVRRSAVPSPLHLIISPYPARYEKHAVTSSGLPVFIRPIKPEDAPLLVDLFHVLSPTSIYFRFFSPLKELSEDMLARFTQVDYDREIGMVAVEAQDTGWEKLLGVARVISDPEGKKAEFAVLVGDPWQGKGIGALLLENCLHIAKERGIETVWGTVLQENTHMLALGRKLGFKICRMAESTDCELTIDLRRVNFDEHGRMMPS